MRLLCAMAVALASLVLAAPLMAQPRSEVEAQLVRAKDRFDYGDYADAVRILRRLIDEGRLASEQQLVEAHRLLGVSLFYCDEMEESRAAFVRLLSIQPDFRLDPFFHPPKLVEVFDQVRAENESLLQPLRDQRRRLEEQRRLEEEARRRLLEEEERRRLERRRLASNGDDRIVERVVSNHSYVVNWLPFGAGQIQNGHRAKAVGLATAQVITGVASILGYAVVEAAPQCRSVTVPAGAEGEPEQSWVECGVPPESVNMVRNMERVKWVTGAMFWGLVTYGIIDAHVHYRPTEIISERRLRLEPAPQIIPVGRGGEDDRSDDGEEDQTSTDRPTDPRSNIEQPRYPSSSLAAGRRTTPRMRLSGWVGPGGAGAGLTLRF
ncbi:MAG: hypothetical protein ACOCVR_03635 [Myxococcota bacterium]